MNTETVTLDYKYNSDGLRTQKVVTTTSDHVHAFQDTVHEATCTENGYTLHSCICGYIYQDSPVAATGHTFTTTVVGTNCTEVGHTVYTCACGYSYEEGSNGHTFTTLVVEPSETVNGLTLHECECGYIYQSDPVASLAGASNGTDVISDTKVYDYVYNGSSLTKLTITTTITGNGTSTKELYFTYDGSSPMTVTYGDDIFYYVTNLQGDVVAIIDTNGVAVVTYTYDAWGNILDIDGSMKDDLGVANPLTYRGYVYDTESGLYYLQSRYYNANVGRFINADAFASTGQGLLGNNMFIYCRNNPVVRLDSSGCRDNGVFSLKNDEVGREILWWYLYGNGEDFPSEKKHSDYLKKNKKLKKQVQDYLFPIADSLSNGESIQIDASISVIIENGEDIIGYQYLHGTNADAGGFHIQGTIYKTDTGVCIFDLTYTWNDIIDPNPEYSSDMIKAQLAQMIPFANPADYKLSISWRDVSFLPAGGKTFENQGYGWLVR